MKRANGSGTVVRYGGNRRKPWVARITTGLVAGKPQVRVIGSYAERAEAERALADYARSPYDVDGRKITMADLYERWARRAKEQGRISTATLVACNAGYRHCELLHDIPYMSIRAHMMQDCVDGCGGGYSSQGKIKNLFYHLDNYAMELDIINKRYSDLVKTATAAPKEKIIFTSGEVAQLWRNKGIDWVDSVLILLYSGWRINELLLMRNDSVNLETKVMCGGIKTRARRDRIVPIHSAILSLVRARVARGGNYLIGNDDAPMEYRVYRRKFASVMALIEARHTPHDTRHTLRSWFDSVSAPLSCVNRIMGHTCGDIGLQTYTHKTIEDLRAAMEMIKT